MDLEYDPADPEAAMREMMGFSSFNKVARGTGKDKDSTSSSYKPSGANSEPLQSRFTDQDFPTYSSQDVRSSIDSTNSSTPLNASASKFVPNIPAFLTPASVLPANLPPKPPTTFQATIPSYDLNSNPSAPGTAPLPNDPPPNTFPPTNNPQPHSSTTRPQPSPFTTSDIRYTPNANLLYTPTYLTDGTLNPANTNPRPSVRLNERGDTVYFKPSFVDPDPWRFAREAKDAKKSGIADARGSNSGSRRDGGNGRGYWGGGGKGRGGARGGSRGQGQQGWELVERQQ